MRPTVAATAALIFVLSGGIARASVPTELAESGGFLLGNAHRCAVPIERIEHAATVIHDLIAAAHAQHVQKLVPAFENLYNAMPDQQKRLADQVFRENAETHAQSSGQLHRGRSG